MPIVRESRADLDAAVADAVPARSYSDAEFIVPGDADASGVEGFTAGGASSSAADVRKRSFAAFMNDREHAAHTAIANRDAAVADLKRHKYAIADNESINESKTAMEPYTVEWFGQGDNNAGGPQGRKRRHEVLDRLSRLGQGLSPDQRDDFAWFKDSWDFAMLEKHKQNWGGEFAAYSRGIWIQDTLDNGSNAFSLFVYNETRRLFLGAGASLCSELPEGFFSVSSVDYRWLIRSHGDPQPGDHP